MMKKKRERRGQGFLEFALIVPVLLLIIIGLIEFGHIFIVYASLTNASREGTRYGIVSPTDYDGINNRVRETIILPPPEEVAINVRYDSGPDTTAFVDPGSVETGSRVRVEVQYDVEALTSFMEPFIPDDMVMRVESARTVQNVRLAGGTPQVAPTFTPDPNASPTPTLEPPATATPDPNVTNTPTPDPNVTPSPTPSPSITPTPSPTPLPPIIISKPVEAGDTSVIGTAAGNETVMLRVIQTGLQRTGLVDANGNFVFDGLPPLVEGHTVIVQGYGTQDLAIVQPAEPTPTPTPAGAFIVLEPDCANSGTSSIDIVVTGYNWSTTKNEIGDIEILWNGTSLGLLDYNDSGTFQTTLFDVQVSEGTHTVEAKGWYKYGNPQQQLIDQASAIFTHPCENEPPTPTPTPPTQPDLIVSNVSLQNTPPLGTYDKLYLDVSVMNVGEFDVTSLFWVDLYADPEDGTPLSDQLSADYVAINALSAGSTVTFTMYVPEGFDTTGEHEVVAMADTWDQITELYEDNNVSASLPISITEENPAPTPTPTPEVPPGDPGAIAGVTYLEGTRQDNVSVYVYDAEGRLWGSGRSGTYGDYEIANIPPGDYIVVGELRMGESLYRAQLGPVTVTSNQTTDLINLYLTEVIQ